MVSCKSNGNICRVVSNSLKRFEVLLTEEVNVSASLEV